MRDAYTVTRRTFLNRTLTSIAAAGLPAWYSRKAIADEREADDGRPHRLGANDTIQFGLIGSGGRHGGFQQGLNDARNANSKSGCKVIAVCDLDSDHLNDAAAVFGSDTLKYHDFRKLLENRAIDAVVIGTPDHWHVQVAIAALRAGKDVYCEKPLTLTIDEGKHLVRTAKETGRVFQVGSQQRSDPRFRLACELVRNGRIGPIKQVTAHLPTGPTGGPYPAEAPPPSLDYNFWLGPTPTIDYCDHRVYGDFRWWLQFSGGMMTDWGAHHNDIAQWGLGTDHTGPVKVQGYAQGPLVGVNCYDTFPQFDIYSTYATGTTLLTTNKGENGVTFDGSTGSIFVSRSRIGASDDSLLTTPLPSDAIHLYVSNDHMQNFVDCIRSRKETICPARIGFRSVTICHLANLSLRLGGRILHWNPERETILDDREASSLLSRPRRHPWTL